jgi:hypothetical protein
MVLDLSKLLSLLCSIVALYWTTVSAFFVPGARWQDRMLAALLRLTIAGCVCFASGLLFSWPARANPDADTPLSSTLPVRLFFCAAAGIVVLFALSWLLTCGRPCYVGMNRNCLCS